MISTLTNKVHILNLSYFHLWNCLSGHSYLDGKKQKLSMTNIMTLLLVIPVSQPLQG
jgi:hypothetical protein